MSNETITAEQAAEALRQLRELWRGSLEAPAARSAVGYFAEAFRAKSEAFDVEAFWVACGYQKGGRP